MKLSVLFALIVVTVLIACNNSHHEKTVEATPKDSVTVATLKQPFEGVEFASKMDLACGMMLTAGVTDTAHYKNKVYGFCSKECKDDFLKTPEAFLASKYRH